MAASGSAATRWRPAMRASSSATLAWSDALLVRHEVLLVEPDLGEVDQETLGQVLLADDETGRFEGLRQPSGAARALRPHAVAAERALDVVAGVGAEQLDGRGSQRSALRQELGPPQVAGDVVLQLPQRRPRRGELLARRGQPVRVLVDVLVAPGPHQVLGVGDETELVEDRLLLDHRLLEAAAGLPPADPAFGRVAGGEDLGVGRLEHVDRGRLEAGPVADLGRLDRFGGGAHPRQPPPPGGAPRCGRR